LNICVLGEIKNYGVVTSLVGDYQQPGGRLKSTPGFPLLLWSNLEIAEKIFPILPEDLPSGGDNGKFSHVLPLRDLK
jgi:hypothetical protein